MNQSTVSAVLSKTCNTCRLERPLTDFYKDSKSPDGKTYRCKPCCKDKQKEKYEAGERYRIFHRKYGVTPDEYNALKDANKGHCQLCGTPESDTKMCVDHCHATGKVRGLICDKCNRALGYVDDNIQTLRNLITYLEQNEPLSKTT